MAEPFGYEDLMMREGEDDNGAEMFAIFDAMLAALKGSIGALEFGLDYHRDLGNEDIAFAADRLDAAAKAIALAEAFNAKLEPVN